jgi:ATP-binding cassette subfamily F protein 3
VALFCDNLSVGYPEKLVGSKIHMHVDRGAHVAVLGDNGQGKTTLLRTIAGDLALKGGSFRWGTGLKIGYYAQHVFGVLNPEDNVLSYLERDAPDGVTRQNVLDLAGSFLFKGTDVEKKIAVLSGGERARLVLAGLLLAKCHVLLLDEPTNHLDFETVEALGQALKEFKGTIFFISHDRTFVNLVATEIVEVKNGCVRKYPGAYEDYTYHLEQEAQGIQQQENRLHEEHLKTSSVPLKAAGAEAEEKRKISAERRAQIAKLKKQIEKSENRVKFLTKEKNSILEEIQKNPFHYSRQRNDRLKACVVSLEEEEAEWLKLQSELETFEKEKLST